MATPDLLPSCSGRQLALQKLFVVHLGLAEAEDAIARPGHVVGVLHQALQHLRALPPDLPKGMLASVREPAEGLMATAVGLVLLAVMLLLNALVSVLRRWRERGGGVPLGHEASAGWAA